MKKITVLPLTQENFAPYGKILTVEGRIPTSGSEATHLWYQDITAIDAPASINMMPIFQRPYVVKTFEIHEHTEEIFYPLDGPAMVVLGQVGELDVGRMAAFMIPQGTGVSFAPGVWHYVPFPLGKTTMCCVVYAKGTGETDCILRDLPEEAAIEL